MSVEARATASTAIARATNDLLDRRIGAGDVLAVYAAKDSEVDTVGIVEHCARQGISIVYPRIVEGASDRVLTFHDVTASELVPGMFGLREPLALAPAIALERIAAFVVPGLAFDLEGGRIGWGRGYYDATLSRAPAALRIGLCFACQLVDRVPRDAHDIAMTHIVTEVATYPVA